VDIVDRKRFAASVVAVVEEGGESRRIPSTRPSPKLRTSLRTFASLQLAQMIARARRTEDRGQNNLKVKTENPKPKLKS